MMSQFGHMLTGIVDTAMVGHIDSTSLAAAALGNSSLILFMTFGFGLSMGIAPLVAGSDGKDNTEEKIQWLRQGMIIIFVASLILSAAVLLFTPMLGYLNQPENVVKLAVPYLMIIGASLIPMLIYQHFKQFAEGLAYTKTAMYISLLSNVINVALNYVLIFGEFGFPRLELIGAGIATLISRIIMAILMILYIYHNQKFKKYRAGFILKKIKKYYINTILKIGVPIGFQYVFEAGAFVFGAFLIGTMGEIQLASHQVAIMLASTSFLTATGIGSAVTVRVGKFLGANDSLNLKRAAKTGALMVIAFMSVMALLFVLLKNVLPPLFTIDKEVQMVTASLLVVAAIFQLSDGVQLVMLSILRGLKDVKRPTFIAVLSYWVISLPIGYLLAFHLNIGVQGIWWGFAIGLTCAAVLLFARYYRLAYGKILIKTLGLLILGKHSLKTGK